MMEDLLEYLENCSCPNNLHMVGHPKSVKHSDLHEICEADLPQALGPNHKCCIENVLRIGPDPVEENGGATPTRHAERLLPIAVQGLLLSPH